MEQLFCVRNGETWLDVLLNYIFLPIIIANFYYNKDLLQLNITIKTFLFYLTISENHDEYLYFEITLS